MCRCLLVAAILSAPFVLPGAALGANQTWSGATNENWGTATNWVGGAAPGISGGSTSTDVATFLTSSMLSPTITNSSGTASVYNIFGINFGVSGSTPSAFTIGATGGSALDLTSGGTIQILSGVTGGITETVNAPLVLETANGSYNFVNNSASDVLDFGGGITAAAVGTSTLFLSGSNTGANTISGNITLSGSDNISVVQMGSGSWTLAGANTHTGPTAVLYGTLSVTGTLSSSSALQLGGGTFSYAHAAAQTVAGLTIEPASGSVITNTNATGNILTLGAITRTSLSAGNWPLGGTVDFSTANGTAHEITTTFTDVNGIIGGWATQGGEATWAVAGSGTATAITPLTSFQADSATSLGVSTSGNTDMTFSGTTTVAGGTVNSLRFNNANADTISTSGVITISSGGILETSSVGGNADSVGGAGSLKGASGKDLVVIQNNPAAALTISVPIIDNTSQSSLTKSGAGTLILTGVNNSYTGDTDVNAGTVILSGAGTMVGQGGAAIVNGNFVVASTALIPFNVSGGTNPTNLWIGGFGNSGGGSNGTVGVANFYIAPQVSGTIEQTNGQTIAIGSFGTGTVFQESGTLSYGGSNGAGIYLGLHGGNGTLDVSSPSGAATASSVTTGTSSGTGQFAIAFTQPNDVGTLNLNGGTVTVNASTTGTSNFQVGGSGGGSAVVNLNGGTLQTQGWLVGGSAVAPVLNFNGGTLQANQGSNNFLNSTTVTPDTVVKIFANGGTIDTNGQSITITEALANATGTGVTGVAYTNPSNIVYTIPPTVTFSGDATGYAMLDSSGHINGIAVTYGGTASSETASISGDSGTLTVSTALNSTGGLTVIGAGALTLSGTNTYTGPTTISAGSLSLTGALGSGGAIAMLRAATIHRCCSRRYRRSYYPSTVDGRHDVAGRHEHLQRRHDRWRQRHVATRRRRHHVASAGQYGDHRRLRRDAGRPAGRRRDRHGRTDHRQRGRRHAESCLHQHARYDRQRHRGRVHTATGKRLFRIGPDAGRRHASSSAPAVVPPSINCWSMAPRPPPPPSGAART